MEHSAPQMQVEEKFSTVLIEEHVSYKSMPMTLKIMLLKRFLLDWMQKEIVYWLISLHCSKD